VWWEGQSSFRGSDSVTCTYCGLPATLLTISGKTDASAIRSTLFCAKLFAAACRVALLRRRSQLGGFSPGCTNPALPGLIPHSASGFP